MPFEVGVVAIGHGLQKVAQKPHGSIRVLVIETGGNVSYDNPSRVHLRVQIARQQTVKQPHSDLIVRNV